MSWGRDDPGYGPSPDPAAAAERYYSEQSRMDGPDEPPWECETCRDRGVIVESDHDPKCVVSNGKSCASLCPVPREYQCPDCSEGRCDTCHGVLAFAGYSGSPEYVYEIYTCPKCDLRKRPATARTEASLVEIDPEEVPF